MSNQEKYSNLIISFLDYVVGEAGYYVTEKAMVRRSDKRASGYRAQTKSVGDSRLKAISWSFQLIQVSRDELVEYVDDYVFEIDNDIQNIKKDDYAQVLITFLDKFIYNYLVFERADTRQNVTIIDGYRSEQGKSKARQESKYEVRFATVQPSRSDFEKQISFFISTYLK